MFNKNLKEELDELKSEIVILKQEVAILNCKKHKWMDYWNGPSMMGYCSVRCELCGKVELILHEEFDEYKLNKALDEVERLGGEVTR